MKDVCPFLLKIRKIERKREKLRIIIYRKEKKRKRAKRKREKEQKSEREKSKRAKSERAKSKRAKERLPNPAKTSKSSAFRSISVKFSL